MAYAALDPTAQNALTIHAYCKNLFADGEIALVDLVYRLDAQSKALSGGDLERAEAMLSAQAHTLDTLFNHLAQRATRAEYVRNFELYLKLALKAQSQCRTTLEALAEIKNPTSVSFVRQANIAHGHQQVNNQGSSDTNGTARAREKLKSAEQTKQVAHDEQSTLDTAAPGTPSRADPAMATVGAVHGAENGQG